MASVPRTLLLVASKLDGFQKNTVSVPPISGLNEYTNGQVMEFELPSSGTVDLESLYVSFYAGCVDSGNDKCKRLPADIHHLIRRIVIKCGGVVLNEADAWNRFKYGTDRVIGRKVPPQCHPEIQRRHFYNTDYSDVTDVDASETLTETKKGAPFVWKDFPGTLLGTSSPRILPLGYMPPVRVEFHLNDKVLTASVQNDTYAQFTNDATGATDEFIIENPHLRVDMVDFSTSIYDSLVQSELANAGRLAIPYKRIRHYRDSVFQVSTDFSIQTGSLDRIHVQISDGTADDAIKAPVLAIGAPTTETGAVAVTPGAPLMGEKFVNPRLIGKYFGGTPPTDGSQDNYAFQFTINGTPAPSYFPTATEWFTMTKNALSEHTCIGDKTSLQEWVNEIGHFTYRLNLPGSPANYLSGLDTLNANTFMTLRAKSSLNTAVRTDIWAEVTAVLNIGPNRTATVVN